MRIGNIPVGGGAPMVLISGLNVIENETDTVEVARTLQQLAEKHDFPLVFKASFDKANRSRHDSFRGPGIDEGLRALAAVKRELGLPILTDVHDPAQPKIAAQVADIIQVPAFLMRQTDLIAACAASGAAVNLKKGQFIAPLDMRHAVDKLNHFGCEQILVTDRGTCFGYNNLVTDMQGLVQMREFAPVCFDATHAVQYPGANGGSSGGDSRSSRHLRARPLQPASTRSSSRRIPTSTVRPATGRARSASKSSTSFWPRSARSTTPFVPPGVS